jgi:hypothetical protein
MSILQVRMATSSSRGPPQPDFSGKELRNSYKKIVVSVLTKSEFKTDKNGWNCARKAMLLCGLVTDDSWDLQS